jgi:SAM-dependent methyltransferase
MRKLIARGRLVIGNAVRRAVAGEFGRVDDEIAELRREIASLSRNAAPMKGGDGSPPTSNAELASARIEALSRRIGLSSPLLWNDLHRPIEPSLPSPHELVRRDGASAEIEEFLKSVEGTPQFDCLNNVASILELFEKDAWPLPSAGDREGYFGGRDIAYTLSGMQDAAFLSTVAARYDLPMGAGSTFLDFGCASGRVLRAFRKRHSDAMAIGVDLNLQDIQWARQTLGNEIVFVQGTTLPHLPLETSSVDLIFAGSVFTHIADFEEAWLLELRRVLRPTGLAVLTVHPERLWTEMRDPEHGLVQLLHTARQRVDPPGSMFESLDLFEHPMPGPRVIFTNVDWPVNNTQVFHSDEWIRDRWGAIFQVRERIAYAHGRHQDGIVMQVPPTAT